MHSLPAVRFVRERVAARAARPTRPRAHRAGRRSRRGDDGSHPAGVGCASSATRRSRAGRRGGGVPALQMLGAEPLDLRAQLAGGVEVLARDARLSRDGLEADGLALAAGGGSPGAPVRALARGGVRQRRPIRWCCVQAAASFPSRRSSSWACCSSCSARSMIAIRLTLVASLISTSRWLPLAFPSSISRSVRASCSRC